MKHYTKIYTAQDVKDAESFATYAQQQIGVPYPTLKMMIATKGTIKRMFAENPGLNWSSLPRIVEWAKARKKRYATLTSLLAGFRWAFQDGYLPELSESFEERTNVDELVYAALRVEKDPDWRRALMLTDSLQEKVSIYNKWVEVRSGTVDSVAI